MGFFDIFIIVPLLWALYSGYKKGIISQVGAIVGLFLGVFVAYYLGKSVNDLMNVNTESGKIVVYIVIAGVVLFIVGIIGRFVGGLVNFMGLGIIDKIGGSVLSFIKMALILCLLLLGFQWFNDQKHIVSEDDINKSLLYKPMIGIKDIVFPYIDFATEKIDELNDKDDKGELENN